MTTDRISERTTARSATGAGAVTGAASSAGSTTRVGSTNSPRAIVPAATAMPSGLTSVRPWPMVAAALSTTDVFAGTSPVNASTPTSQPSPMPIGAAAAASASSPSSPDSATKAVLQDAAKSSANVTSPSASPSKFLKERPSTVWVVGHGTDCSGVTPGGQQGLRADRLERRARRVLAGHGPVGARGGSVGHRQHGAGRDVDGHERGVAVATRSATRRCGRQRRVGRTLHGRVQGQRDRGARDGVDREQLGRLVSPHPVDHDAGSACQALVVRALQARQPGLVAGHDPAVRLLDDLGGRGSDAAEQCPGELARRCERLGVLGEHGAGQGSQLRVQRLEVGLTQGDDVDERRRVAPP